MFCISFTEKGEKKKGKKREHLALLRFEEDIEEIM